MELSIPYGISERISRIRFNRQIQIPAWILCLLALLVNNGFYLFICMVTLLILIRLLWFQRHPGIIMFAFFMQWVQVVGFVWWMMSLGFEVDRVSPNAPLAIILSCIGLVLMAVVLNLRIRPLGMPSIEYLQAEALKINDKKLLLLYVISTALLTSAGFVFGITSGFAQILTSVSDLKWLFMLWYGYVVWIKRKNRIYLLYIAVYEFAAGFYSFFSSFKEVLFFIIILLITFIVRIKGKQLIGAILTCAVFIWLFLSWIVIKGDYRQFLNQGTRKQAVHVTREEAYTKVFEQVSNLSMDNYRLSLNTGLYRVQYVYHFALAIDRVPALMPYQNGQVWLDNITFVLTPRLLFPDKEIYDASIKTSKFTGRRFAGQQQGASFSLGYFADAYVDFGPIWMFIPIILIGFFVSAIYRTFYKMENLNVFLRFAIINVVLYVFISFESDGLFLFGRLFIGSLTFFILAKTVFPALQRWVYK
ncbi:MAG TPA: hypothetical protein VD993_12755 [Chitinophagaceae bacterium]|nr:hypothetical protein [Chitinophagaceae bacterium]